MESDWDKYISLGRPIYRSREKRKLITKMDKTSWFRKKGATSIITVPTTKKSDLVNIIVVYMHGAS